MTDMDNTQGAGSHQAPEDVPSSLTLLGAVSLGTGVSSPKTSVTVRHSTLMTLIR
ncbi:MAG: hypothetical protein ACPGIJ_00335 [Mycobacterium sp.]